MNANQLVRTVEINPEKTMAIYKLTDEQIFKYSHGKQFMLKPAEFSEYAYQNMTDDELITVYRGYIDEGFFETEREAYLTAMLLKAREELHDIRSAVVQIVWRDKKVGSMDFTWDYDYKSHSDKEV